jgi:zinc/manganese transport system substrate-binding protein
MKILSMIVIGFGLLIATPANAQINVFACGPEWKALAEEIGGDKLKAYSATTANQDAHHIRAKPSLIAKMRNTDLVICSGAGLEIGWLPVLLQKAGNAKTQTGGVGNLEASQYVNILDIPTSVDRSMGDVHPEGNPHIHLNPYNILKVADELTLRLKKLDAENADYYQSRFADFSGKWNVAIKKWELQAASLKGKKVIVHHKDLNYLLDWLDLQEAASLEEKPGIPPSSSYLEKVLQTARSNQIMAILRIPSAPDDDSKWLSKKTNIPALVVPYTVGGNVAAVDLFSLFDETIRVLNDAK